MNASSRPVSDTFGHSAAFWTVGVVGEDTSRLACVVPYTQKAAYVLHGPYPCLLMVPRG